MGRISRTFELAGSSWRVLKADKELILLPVLSLLATLAVAASFLIPLLSTCVDTAVASGSCELATVDYVLLAVMYLVLAFVTIFFNAALVHAANERMSGGDPTLGSALRGAAMRVHRIFPWAVISATVSIILRSIEERAGWLGSIIAGIAGIAWSLVTFLVIPVLVIEDVRVTDAIKKSGSMFKKTWGENVAAQIGFGLLGFLLVLPAIPVVAIGIGAGGAIAVILIAAAVAWILLASMVVAALNGIFQTALYRYAAGLEAPGFGGGDLSGAFAPKRRRGVGFGGGIAG